MKFAIVQHKRDVGFFALWRNAPAYRAALLQVDVPRFFLAGVLEREGEDAVPRFDCGFAVGWRRGEGGLNGVEGGGRREVVWFVLVFGWVRVVRLVSCSSGWCVVATHLIWGVTLCSCVCRLIERLRVTQMW